MGSTFTHSRVIS